MAKKDLFDEEEGDDKAADKKAIESVKEKVAERQGAVPEGDLEIDVDKAEEELDEHGPARESRNDRRRNRYREVQERSAAAERRAEDAERRERETRELVMQLRQQAPMQQPQQPAAPREDPLDEELGSAFREQDMLYRDFNNRHESLTAQEHEEFARRVRDLQRKIVVAGGKIALRDSGLQQGGNERQIRAAVTAARLQEEAGDVLSDDRKKMYFDGAWRQLIASGRKDDWTTITDAAESTRRKFGMASKTRQMPSESYKRKLTGAPRGAGAGGNEARVVVMNESHRAMADASYRHIKDQGERYKRWAAGPGARLLDKGH